MRRFNAWQKACYEQTLRPEADIKSVGRYRIANLLPAGLAQHIGEYPLWNAAWL